MIKKLKKIAIIMTLTGTAIMLNSCNALKYKPVDAREFPPEPDKRVQKNIEEGKGFRIFDMNKDKTGTFDFASSNELWRASLEIIDFIPLVSANYSGGIIITDWYSNNQNTNESIKISIRFLTNEIRSDALNIKDFTRVCSDNLNCKTYENNQDLVPELTKQILKTATLYKKQKLEKTKEKNKDLVINYPDMD